MCGALRKQVKGLRDDAEKEKWFYNGRFCKITGFTKRKITKFIQLETFKFFEQQSLNCK